MIGQLGRRKISGNFKSIVLFLSLSCCVYKCAYCSKLLLPTVEEKIECISSRMWVDNHGNVKYIHLKDPTWDVSEYILSLKTSEKHWRNVFWKLWGVLNYLQCSVCQVGCVFLKGKMG